MPSTVYRGDLSEVTFGHESAIRLEHNYAVQDLNKHNYKHKKHLRISKRENLVRDSFSVLSVKVWVSLVQVLVVLGYSKQVLVKQHKDS